MSDQCCYMGNATSMVCLVCGKDLLHKKNIHVCNPEGIEKQRKLFNECFKNVEWEYCGNLIDSQYKKDGKS